MADSGDSVEFALQINLGGRTDGDQDPVQRLRPLPRGGRGQVGAADGAGPRGRQRKRPGAQLLGRVGHKKARSAIRAPAIRSSPDGVRPGPRPISTRDSGGWRRAGVARQPSCQCRRTRRGPPQERRGGVVCRRSLLAIGEGRDQAAKAIARGAPSRRPGEGRQAASQIGHVPLGRPWRPPIHRPGEREDGATGEADLGAGQPGQHAGRHLTGPPVGAEKVERAGPQGDGAEADEPATAFQIKSTLEDR